MAFEVNNLMHHEVVTANSICYRESDTLIESPFAGSCGTRCAFLPGVRSLYLWFLVFAATVLASPLTTAAPVTHPASSRPAPCSLESLPGVGAQIARIDGALRDFDHPAGRARSTVEAGLLDDLNRVGQAVAGWREPIWVVASESGARRVGRPTPAPAVPCDAAARSRDGVAWSMARGGYSAKEIADVLNGHLTRGDLDEAQKLLMVGRGRASVAAFLDARWRDAATSGTASPQIRLAAVPLARFDAHIARMAREHQLDVALVKAVIEAESGWDPRAVSRAGAIGLMQLMPATASILGVDPWNPLENIRGGVTYLADMLRAYDGDVGLALVAYNAGPQHADRVRSGRALPYNETRRYLDAIRLRYPRF